MLNMVFNREHERGSLKAWMVSTISLIAALVITIGVAAWAYMQYIDQKTNVDSRIDEAVATAKKDQADEDEVKFLERDKLPNREFSGPSDYGSVSFMYPKTWSVYVDKDASNGGDYEAYLNPVAVPPISSKERFALRVVIDDGTTYEKVVGKYSTLVKKGSLKSSSVKIDGVSGTRLDGSFSDDIRGAAVIVKIRDKVLTIKTDADTFKNDFNALIKTITFND